MSQMLPSMWPMQYLRYMYAKQVFVVYLKVQLNWASCVLIGFRHEVPPYPNTSPLLTSSPTYISPSFWGQSHSWFTKD